MKHIIISFVISLVTFTSNARTYYIDGIYYKLNYSNYTASVISGSTKYTGDISIPSSVNVYNDSFKVTSIGNKAFEGCTELNSIIIPYSIITIEDFAFYNCTSLLSIQVESGNTVYDSRENCNAIIKTADNTLLFGCQNTVIPDGVSAIGEYAFYNCKGLTSISIPNSVMTIGEYAFRGCISLKNVAINSDVLVSKDYNDSYNNNSFHNVFGPQVTQYVLGDSITKIGKYTFYNCTELSQINIPEGVTSIGLRSFYSCKKIRDIYLGSKLNSIGEEAFSGCDSLKKITINSNTIVSKDENSYYATIRFIFGNRLNHCIIGDSVRKIGANCFYGCSSLKSVQISDNIVTIGHDAFNSCSNLETINMPKSLTTIGAAAFSGCTNMKIDLSLQNTTEIGANAFEGCSKIDAFLILQHTKSIGSKAFKGCSNIQSIHLSDSLTFIGPEAFSGCKRIKEIYIGNRVGEKKSFQRTALFNGCDSLNKVTLNSNYITSTNYSAYDNDGFSYIFGPQVKQYILGDSIKRIGNCAFYNCQNIEDLYISKNVNDISSGAITYCNNLSSIKVDEKNTKYDSRNSCNAIIESSSNKMIVGCNNTLIPQEIEEIGDYAFTNCTNETKILLPDNIHNIGYSAFYGCSPCANRGTSTLLALWRAGYVPYQIGTDIVLSKPYVSTLSTTQTTATCIINNYYEEYKYELAEKEVGSEFIIEGLVPNHRYNHYYIWVLGNTDSDYFSCGISFTTKPLNLKIDSNCTSPTTLNLKETHDEGDAILQDGVFEIMNNNNGSDILTIEGDSCIITRLEPNTYYKCTFKTIVNGVEYATSTDVKTAQLEFVVAQPKVVSEGNVIVSAQTNLNDNENVGFAWRRTDWTSDFASKTATAYLYEGTMEGTIHNLNSNYLWKYCPYFVSASGKYYYGSWMGIDPTDISYFEPIVHTFAQVAVVGNTAMVKGSALQGTEYLNAQGFKCWPQRLGEQVPEEATVVSAGGQMMNATFSDLTYNTPYYYTAFVTTSVGTSYYGAVRTFTTDPNLSGIEEKKAELNTISPVGVYSISGFKIANSYDDVRMKLPRGIYIVNGKKVNIK